MSERATLSATVSAASFWFPRHYVETAWAEHAPFAFWLIDAVRPRTVVELGTQNGFSFFVFAEGARRLELSTQLTAIDTWKGDDQAGFYGEEVFEHVTGIAQTDYPATTTLIRAYFSDAASQIPDGSVDLLHIDGRHGYNDVKEDFETYRAKLSDRGVVIFHDTHEFQPRFGVHRLWSEVEPTAPSFEFHHGHGLGVLATGENAPPPLLEFLRLANADPGATRASYQALGREVADRMDTQTREIEALRAVIEDYRTSTSWRVTAPLRRLMGLIRRPKVPFGAVPAVKGQRAAATPSRPRRAS